MSGTTGNNGCIVDFETCRIGSKGLSVYGKYRLRRQQTRRRSVILGSGFPKCIVNDRPQAWSLRWRVGLSSQGLGWKRVYWRRRRFCSRRRIRDGGWVWDKGYGCCQSSGRIKASQCLGRTGAPRGVNKGEIRWYGEKRKPCELKARISDFAFC